MMLEQAVFYSLAVLTLLSALGVVLFIGVLVAVRELRTLARLTYTAMLVGLVLLLLPLAPHIGRKRAGSLSLSARTARRP